MDMGNLFNISAWAVEIIGVSLIFLNLIEVFSELSIGILVLSLSIAGFLNNERKAYCYLTMLIDSLTLISPVLVILAIAPF